MKPNQDDMTLKHGNKIQIDEEEEKQEEDEAADASKDVINQNSTLQSEDNDPLKDAASIEEMRNPTPTDQMRISPDHQDI